MTETATQASLTADPALDAAVAEVLPEALELSHRVHAAPEIAFVEHQASRWSAELLQRHGFEVTAPVGGLETALTARWRGERPGPVVALAGEYDALPEVGHGCGHNLMCSSSAGGRIGDRLHGRASAIWPMAEDPMNRCRTMVNNGVLLDVWRRHLAAAGWEDGPLDPNTGSTDMTNVSHRLPTIHPTMAIAPEGTPGHSREFAGHAGGEGGDGMLPVAMRVLAASAVELLRTPAVVDQAWEELRGRAGRGIGERSG